MTIWPHLPVHDVGGWWWKEIRKGRQGRAWALPGSVWWLAHGMHVNDRLPVILRSLTILRRRTIRKGY